MKAFIYLAPEDIYFTAIISQCISELSFRYPGCRHIVIPVFGVKFSSRFPIYSIRFVKSIFHYYLGQATLSLRVKRLVELSLDNALRKNIRYLNLFDWLMAKDRTPLAIGNFQDELDFINHYELDGISIGDLVCDTYLRFKPSPVFDFTDSFTLGLLILAKQYARLIDSVFKKYQVGLVFGSYTTYVYHGVAHRIAISKGVNTIAFGGGNSFARVNKLGEVPLQVAPYETYCFNGLHGYDADLINLATNSLGNRIASSYDTTVSYMDPERELQEDKDESLRGSIVIFLHDFFDSPHGYRWILFPDFYTWIIDTIDFCIAQNIIIFIKPHPNQSKDSEHVVFSLREKYEASQCINWLDSRLRNSSIYAVNPALIVTVYGSVAPEACYAGIPVLLAGDHPCINFPIGKTARSRDDYFSALLNPLSVPSGDPEAAIAFTIQHNMNLFQKEGQSLFSYLGCSFDKLYANPEILQSQRVSKFIKYEVIKLIDSIED